MGSDESTEVPLARNDERSRYQKKISITTA